MQLDKDKIIDAVAKTYFDEFYKINLSWEALAEDLRQTIRARMATVLKALARELPSLTVGLGEIIVDRTDEIKADYYAQIKEWGNE